MDASLRAGSLRVIGVFDRGIPNNERIVLVAEEQTNLAHYGLVIGEQSQTGGVIPFRDRFLWLGDSLIDKSTWVYVYTAPGKFRYTTVVGTTIPAIVLHWGSKTTLLNNPASTMALFTFGEVAITPIPADTKQFPKPQS